MNDIDALVRERDEARAEVERMRQMDAERRIDMLALRAELMRWRRGEMTA